MDSRYCLILEIIHRDFEQIMCRKLDNLYYELKKENLDIERCWRGPAAKAYEDKHIGLCGYVDDTLTEMHRLMDNIKARATEIREKEMKNQ